MDEFPFNAGTTYHIPSLFRIEQVSDDTYRVRTTTPARLSIRTPYRRAFLEHGDGARTELETQETAGMLTLTIHPRTTQPHEILLRLG